MVDKENDSLDLVSSRICDETTQMTAKLDVSSSRKRVPHDAFSRPEQSDKAVHALGVTKRGYISRVSFFCPATFNFGKEFGPLLVLETDKNFFLKRAGAMRL